MKADEYRIRPQCDGVREPILAGRQVNHTMLSDCLSEFLGIVRRAVTLDAKGADIHPRIHWRQTWYVGLDWFWQCPQWCCLIDVLNRRCGTHVFEVKPMRKSLHLVYFRRSRNLLSALAVSRKNGDPAADDVFHVDLCASIVLVANDQSGAADVFHAPIFQPELIRVGRIDGNGSGDILKLRADQGQTSFVLSDRRFALPFERSVDDRELPSWRRFPGPDAILTPIKMHVFCYVAAVVTSGQSRANVEVHVRQEAMLGIVSAYTHSTGISVLNFDVDIAHGRIERTRAGIPRSGICARATTREEHHVGGA